MCKFLEQRMQNWLETACRVTERFEEKAYSKSIQFCASLSFCIGVGKEIGNRNSR